MDDLKYDGKDPLWRQLDFAEHMKSISGENRLDPNDQRSLAQTHERLTNAKVDLASKLARVQNLLKVQVDIDKRTQAMHQAEMDQLTGQIRQNNGRIRDLNSTLRLRIRKLTDVKRNKTGLTIEELARHNASLRQLEDQERKLDKEDDFMGDDVIDDGAESEIAPEENVLHLKITNAQFDTPMITQLNGGRPLPERAMTSFVAVDFFDHESKITEPPAQGYEPYYDTLICFKNLVDNFYLRYCEKDFIHVDVFMLESRP